MYCGYQLVGLSHSHTEVCYLQNTFEPKLFSGNDKINHRITSAQHSSSFSCFPQNLWQMYQKKKFSGCAYSTYIKANAGNNSFRPRKQANKKNTSQSQLLKTLECAQRSRSLMTAMFAKTLLKTWRQKIVKKSPCSGNKVHEDVDETLLCFLTWPQPTLTASSISFQHSLPLYMRSWYDIICFQTVKLFKCMGNANKKYSIYQRKWPGNWNTSFSDLIGPHSPCGLHFTVFTRSNGAYSLMVLS